MFAAGVSTFVLLYATQPLLPLLAHDFHVSPASSSLTLALSTGALALALLPASICESPSPARAPNRS